MITILAILLGLFMIYAGFGHILRPHFYKKIMPPLLNPTLVHVVALVLEVAVGILLLIPATRHWGGLAFMALMIFFLPLHIWDLFKDDPITKTRTIGVIRLVIQIVAIVAGWWIWVG